MAAWTTRAMGILFGGVTDEDTNEETLESIYHNDLCVTASHVYAAFLTLGETDLVIS